MMKDVNLIELADAGRTEEASQLLTDGIHLVGATGERSLEVAIKAARELFEGDFYSTVLFMNRHHPWLKGKTPLEHAEESDEGREFVMNLIDAAVAGVYI